MAGYYIFNTISVGVVLGRAHKCFLKQLKNKIIIVIIIINHTFIINVVLFKNMTENTKRFLTLFGVNVSFLPRIIT